MVYELLHLADSREYQAGIVDIGTQTRGSVYRVSHTSGACEGGLTRGSRLLVCKSSEGEVFPK
jgi:hypothetical protein